MWTVCTIWALVLPSAWACLSAIRTHSGQASLPLLLRGYVEEGELWNQTASWVLCLQPVFTFEFRLHSLLNSFSHSKYGSVVSQLKILSLAPISWRINLNFLESLVQSSLSCLPSSFFCPLFSPPLLPLTYPCTIHANTLNTMSFDLLWFDGLLEMGPLQCPWGSSDVYFWGRHSPLQIY